VKMFRDPCMLLRKAILEPIATVTMVDVLLPV